MCLAESIMKYDTTYVINPIKTRQTHSHAASSLFTCPKKPDIFQRRLVRIPPESVQARRRQPVRALVYSREMAHTKGWGV